MEGKVIIFFQTVQQCKNMLDFDERDGINRKKKQSKQNILGIDLLELKEEEISIIWIRITIGVYYLLFELNVMFLV